MSAGVIFLFVLAFLLVIFTLQNSSPVTLEVFFWEINDVPLIIALMACLAGGYLIGYAIFFQKNWDLNERIRDLQKKISRIEDKNMKLEANNVNLEIVKGTENESSGNE